MPKVTIRWGKWEKCEQDYEFETEAEVNAFLHGVAEGDGWDDWEQIDESEAHVCDDECRSNGCTAR